MVHSSSYQRRQYRVLHVSLNFQPEIFIDRAVGVPQVVMSPSKDDDVIFDGDGAVPCPGGLQDKLYLTRSSVHRKNLRRIGRIVSSDEQESGAQDVRGVESPTLNGSLKEQPGATSQTPALVPMTLHEPASHEVDGAPLLGLPQVWQAAVEVVGGRKQELHRGGIQVGVGGVAGDVVATSCSQKARELLILMWYKMTPSTPLACDKEPDTGEDVP